MANGGNSNNRRSTARKRFDDFSPEEIEILGKAEKKYQIMQGGVGGGALFVMGLFLLVLSVALWESDLLALLILGIVFMVGGVVFGVCFCLYHKRMSLDELAIRRISRLSVRSPFYIYGTPRNLFPRSKSKASYVDDIDPRREIQSGFYKGWGELLDMGIHPQIFEDGGRYRGNCPIDVLVDEESGRLAVCSFDEKRIYRVYDLKKIIGCELQTNGKVVMQSAVGGFQNYEDGFDLNSEPLTGIEPSDANGEDKAMRNEFKVVAVYDDLSEIDMSFEFDDQKDLAERLYRLLSIIVRRNGKAEEVATGDSSVD